MESLAYSIHKKATPGGFKILNVKGKNIRFLEESILISE